jgi:hypothetical protein
MPIESGVLADVFPYLGILGDTRSRLENGRTFRFLAYSRIAGYPKEPRAAALLDEDYQLVLVDGLFSESKTCQELLSQLAALAEMTFPELAAFLHCQSGARHKLLPSGHVPF